MAYKKSNTKKRHARLSHKKTQQLRRSRRYRHGGMLSALSRGVRLTGKKLAESYAENVKDDTFERKHSIQSAPKFDPNVHEVVYSKSAMRKMRSPSTRRNTTPRRGFSSPRSPTIMVTPSTAALSTGERYPSPTTSMDSPNEFLETGRFGLSDMTNKSHLRKHGLTEVSSNLLSKFDEL
jgi:hypothetical protein